MLSLSYVFWYQWCRLFQLKLIVKLYKTKLQNLTFSEASEYYQKIQMLDPVIRHLDSRYFSYPFGSGHFHGNLQKSKSFTIDQYLTQTFEDLMLPNTIKKTTYVKYLNRYDLILLLNFHQLIYLVFFSPLISQKKVIM